MKAQELRQKLELIIMRYSYEDADGLAVEATQAFSDYLTSLELPSPNPYRTSTGETTESLQAPAHAYDVATQDCKARLTEAAEELK